MASTTKPTDLLLANSTSDSAVMPRPTTKLPLLPVWNMTTLTSDSPAIHQTDRAVLPVALAAGDRGGAVRAAADDLVERHLALMAVRQTDHGHAEMQQVRDDREQRRFLAAVLGRGRRERAADFAVQDAAHPQAAGLIEEARHLR